MFIRPGKTGPDLSDEGSHLKALPHTLSKHCFVKFRETSMCYFFVD